jgi:hypothetical protein
MSDFIIFQKSFGKAVMAGRRFSKGEKVIHFRGRIMHRSELPSADKIVQPKDDRYLQVATEYFIGPSDEIDDLINHSCDPNTAVYIDKHRRAVLRALRDINIGEEIAYDYSPLMHNEDWTMKCKCGSADCRGIIREFKFLPVKKKQEYLALGIVPKYNCIDSLHPYGRKIQT